ncbi:TonB-dependent receptor [Helicobacter pullorum]|uniref:TonB-dependent receptor n=1 Tax=Helicobacter pullorum TaxID=35818 RepID=UPI00081686F2|nr:TonB-dependent receptor [Helicobacter pullorum]OCR05321.1 TonB-dependent receptor [Helicobacter pullorum]OCR07901.1 TonB-dependent receptor [Helicobacter pullorum]OCR11879.1 TonB-dependent receptor [Helicobacter pullorum]OCR12807.1 TonB-dependent receptor [Helicobacter pullorum]
MKSHKNLQPRGFRKKYFSLAAILMLNSTLIAQSQNIALNEKSSETKEQSLKLSIIHADEFVENTDFKEEFSAEEIKQSNAQNIYEFLELHSLLKITSNYGNPYTQNIDLRGFGQNGHKNLAIIVDGMRLNNIDSAPISLSAIPLDSIQKIEIIRGKGTTKYGNGAVSGVLKITTTRKAGGKINLSYASYDTFNSQFFARHAGDNLNIGLYGQYQNSQGSRRISSDSDEKDGSYNKNGGITLFYYPDDSLLLRANMNYSKYGIKYADPLTKEQFDSNPTQAGDTFTHQKRWDLYHNVGLTYFANNGLVTEINFGGNRNESEYINFANLYEGKGLYGNFNSQYKNDSYLAEIGGEIKQNQRSSSTEKAQVSEILLYLNGEKYFKDSTLNLGISAQRVINQQKGDGTYSTQENLIGGELGYNYQIHPLINLFASYSRTFVTPNVDWLLRYDPITSIPSPNDTATFDTFQIGTNAVFGIHKLSGSVFYIQGHDENYYDPNIGAFGTNQTLGKTRRIGGEVKFTTYFLQNLYSTLSYAYVDATMQGNEGYKGNTIPGVSKHTFIVGLNYLPIPNLNLGISYKYASKAYDYNDFDNTLEKMPNYQSLNVTLSYTLKDFEIYAFANNLTDHKNALVVSGGYYPYEFETIFGGGVKYKF